MASGLPRDSVPPVACIQGSSLHELGFPSRALPLGNPASFSGDSREVSSPSVLAVVEGPLAPGVPDPGTFRLQAFSTSWRFLPRNIYQPCFMLIRFQGSLSRVCLGSSRQPVLCYHSLSPLDVRVANQQNHKTPRKITIAMRKLTVLTYRVLTTTPEARPRAASNA